MEKGELLLKRSLLSTGSTWIKEDQLMDYIHKNGGHSYDIEHSLKKGTIIYHNGCYTTSYYEKCENDIAINVMRLRFLNSIKPYPVWKIKELVHKFEKEQNQGKKLHYHQVDAVIMVVNNNVSVLTGGPGTGKTTVISAITYVLRALETDVQIIFTAPTGKASRRITESTGESACTIHKQLELNFNSKEAKKFMQDVLFVDESSMNDVEISAQLFKSIDSGKRVVYVGDIDQLSSIGPGAVLRDLIASRTVPVTMLTFTFRQDNGSILYENILRIRNGNADLLEGNDFHKCKLPNGKNQTQAAISHICVEAVNAIKKYGAENVIVIVPYRKSGICSNLINNRLQNILNKNPEGYRHVVKEDQNVVFFKVNDFVMQLENREECVNGDIGKVVKVSSNGLTVQYLDNVIAYAPNELNQLALAYAMTIHKSQGSEYKAVVMCLLEEHGNMLQRNLIYTGITRAKNEVTLIYQENALKKAIASKANEERLTMLADKLVYLRQQYRIVYGA